MLTDLRIIISVIMVLATGCATAPERNGQPTTHPAAQSQHSG